MIYARVRIAQGKPEVALARLNGPMVAAEQAGQIDQTIEILMLQALAYSANGDLAVSSDALNQVTQYAYANPRHPHYLTEITDPRGVVTRFAYNAMNQLLSQQGAAGVPATFEYDRNGNLTRLEEPGSRPAAGPWPPRRAGRRRRRPPARG